MLGTLVGDNKSVKITYLSQYTDMQENRLRDSRPGTQPSPRVFLHFCNRGRHVATSQVDDLLCCSRSIHSTDENKEAFLFGLIQWLWVAGS